MCIDVYRMVEMNEAQRGKETLEQAIERIARDRTKIHPKQIGNYPVALEMEAALREMAAWAYEDAAQRLRSATPGVKAKIVASVLEKQAAAIRKGE